jgi:6-phosphofructokinase 1
MGRLRGFLAITVGITVGAEITLIPEDKSKMDQVVQIVKENACKGKKAGIIVAAEGCGNVSEIAKEIEEKTGSEVRLSILGYAQRGGSPTARSRLLASLFAERAVELLLQGKGNLAVALQKGEVKSVAFEKVCSRTKPLDLSLMNLAEMLAT